MQTSSHYVAAEDVPKHENGVHLRRRKPALEHAIRAGTSHANATLEFARRHDWLRLLLALLQGLGRLKNWRCRHFEFDNKALNGLRKRHMGRQRSEAQQGTGKDNSSHTRL